MTKPNTTQSATRHMGINASTEDNPSAEATLFAEKICLLILGMHRSGTSALTRVMNMLGYALPSRVIGALEGNEAGHWEPENIVLFNERLLADMKSSWHDFQSLPMSRLGPAEVHIAQAQIVELLDREYRDQARIILKDPRLCRFASIYMQALEGLGYQVVPIIAFRSPAEVIRSLQNRRSNWPEGYGASQAALMWLRHVLDAEFSSRGMRRSFSEYGEFLKDWRSEVSRIAQQSSLDLSESVKLTAPLIDEFLRPELRHENDGPADISNQPALRGWCHKAHDALRKLVVAPDSPEAMETLDLIRSEFNAAELSLADLSDSSVVVIQDVSEKLRQAEHDNSQKIGLLKSRDEEILRLRQHIHAQDIKIFELNDLFHDRNLHIDRLRLQAYQLEQSFLLSRSWRVTAPLRTTGRILRSVRNAGRSFKAASSTKGGLIAGTGVALRVLITEGPKGLAARMENPNSVPWSRAEPPASVDPSTCFIAATEHVMSLAQMMANVLRQEGYSVTIRKDLEGANIAANVFVICPQMFDALPNRYIAVQMEQSVSSRWFSRSYFDRLNQAQAIIDYSVANLRFLRENNLPLNKLYYVPLDSDPTLLPSHDAPRSGILFYGDDKCPRRQRILEAVRLAYPDLKVVTNLFGDELQQELQRAAVVLNIHYYENALLETTRIYQALSHGTPVVSEEASDQSEHKILEGLVDFAPVNDAERIIELLRPYVEGGEAAEGKRAEIIAFAQRKDNRFEMFFRRFLLAQRMIDYDAFLSRAPSYPIELGETVQLCLSLPETPERRGLFLQQERNDFQVWDGLKATPGWVGAALSYRNMFDRIIGTGAEQAIVCEDDVLFPPDFDKRFAIVERYLKDRQWDMFSGFIADVHADVNVIDVEEFEGQTFVHIDRTVSMVFNIYKREVMEFLSKWNPENSDVNSNTIDRYLERRGESRVILTLPFLVNHRPDASSTLWGFENTHYDTLVEQSEIILSEKIAEFWRKKNNVGRIVAQQGRIAK